MNIFMKVNTATHYEIATTRMGCIVCFRFRVNGAFLMINKYQFLHVLPVLHMAKVLAIC